MFLVGLLTWWYGAGWQNRLHRTMTHISDTVAFFSIGQLLSTLFSPFRQISANGVNSGPLEVRIRAAVDKLVSRAIGAVVRLLTVTAGIVIIALAGLYHIVILSLWFVMPLLIVAGCVMAAIGWTPKL